MLKTGNPVHDFNQWDEEQYIKAQGLPVCYGCGERIFGEFYYEIADHVYCEDCIEAAKKYNNL